MILFFFFLDFFFLIDVDQFSSLYWICYNIAPVVFFIYSGILVMRHVGS